MIEVAERLHALTRAHNVPLIINDRLDVALAVGAEGVHIGQDDMGMRPPFWSIYSQFTNISSSGENCEETTS